MRVLIIFFVLISGFTATIAQTSDCNLLYKVDGKESAYPRLSKDKKTILFQSNRNGNWQIWFLDIATKKQTQLTKDTSNNNFPDWSSDNEWISFVSDRDGNEEIYLMKKDGSGLQKITNDPGRDIHPYFSQDGQYILFSSTRGNKSLDIYRYTIKTKKTERLTISMDDETCARYSPDMKKIVFLKNNALSDDIYVLDVTNFLTDNITNSPRVEHGWPMFSADGKWIYYSSMESGTYSIYRIHPDGNGKQQITFPEEGEEDARVFVSDDGKTMIYNKKIGRTIEIRMCNVK